MNQVIVEQTEEVVMELVGEKVPDFLTHDCVIQDGWTLWPTYKIKKSDDEIMAVEL